MPPAQNSECEKLLKALHTGDILDKKTAAVLAAVSLFGQVENESDLRFWDICY